MHTLAHAHRGREIAAIACLYTAGALTSRAVPCLASDDDEAPSGPPPIAPGDYDPNATADECRCPECGSSRGGYPITPEDPCLNCEELRELEDAELEDAEHALPRALKVAADRGWLLLPDLGIPELAQPSGEVLRFDARAPSSALAAAIVRAVEAHAPQPPTPPDDEEERDEPLPAAIMRRQVSPLVLHLAARRHADEGDGGPNLRELLALAWGGPHIGLAIDALEQLAAADAGRVLVEACSEIAARGASAAEVAFLDALHAESTRAALRVLDRAGVGADHPLTIATEAAHRLLDGEADGESFEALRAIASYLQDVERFSAIALLVLEAVAEHRAGLRSTT